MVLGSSDGLAFGKRIYEREKLDSMDHGHVDGQ